VQLRAQDTLSGHVHTDGRVGESVVSVVCGRACRIRTGALRQTPPHDERQAAASSGMDTQDLEDPNKAGQPTKRTMISGSSDVQRYVSCFLCPNSSHLLKHPTPSGFRATTCSTPRSGVGQRDENAPGDWTRQCRRELHWGFRPCRGINASYLIHQQVTGLCAGSPDCG
jgi:hypothetical protein